METSNNALPFFTQSHKILSELTDSGYGLVTIGLTQDRNLVMPGSAVNILSRANPKSYSR